MNDTERLREIATSIIETSDEPNTVKNAAELLKLASEIEGQRAGARKFAVEEEKIRSDLKVSPLQLKSEDRKAHIALLAPVFTTLVLAGTLVLQSYQFLRSERDKDAEARRQADVAEDVRWADAVRLLSQSEKLSPAGVLLKNFVKSERYRDQAYQTARQILVKTDDSAKFASLFGSVFDPMEWNNLSQVIELDRTLHSRINPLLVKSWDPKKRDNDTKRLSSTEQAEFNGLSAEVKFVTGRIGALLKNPRPAGVTVDLRAADLWVGDFQGADLSGANLSETILADIDLRGANLTGITEYQGITCTDTAWWRASRIGQDLLEELKRTCPYDKNITANLVRSFPRSEYDPAVVKLQQFASKP